MNRDPAMLRLVVHFLGSIVLTCSLGIVLLALLGRSEPPLLGYLATAALGGLTAILVNVPRSPNGNAHVEPRTGGSDDARITPR